MSKEWSLREFAAHLAAIERGLAKSASTSGAPMHDAMQRACVLVQRSAQELMGTYRRTAGPFPAWQRLTEATNEDRQRQGYLPDMPLLRTGEMAYSIKFTIEGDKGYVGSDDPIAIYQELGTATIPARSFLGRAAYINEFKIHKLFVIAVLDAFGPKGLAGVGRMTTQVGFGGIEL